MLDNWLQNMIFALQCPVHETTSKISPSVVVAFNRRRKEAESTLCIYGALEVRVRILSILKMERIPTPEVHLLSLIEEA